MLTRAIIDLLRCPVCIGKLTTGSDSYGSIKSFDCGVCSKSYPLVGGVPILINDECSVFETADFVAQRATYFKRPTPGLFRDFVRRHTPALGCNIASEGNYRRFAALMPRNSRILIVGGGEEGDGMSTALDQFQLVETDVALTPLTSIVCDGHELPFAPQSFDAVVAQAVLEHVVDPYKCVEEIWRVLKPGGLVYAETPFMQQVHSGKYDFTRFTELGHRRLFRKFDALESGMACGPGMALAWSYRYFLTSFTTSRKLGRLLEIFASFTAFWLKYFDSYLAKKPAALDAASGVYFMGRKSDAVLCDRELLKLYRGRPS